MERRYRFCLLVLVVWCSIGNRPFMVWAQAASDSTAAVPAVDNTSPATVDRSVHEGAGNLTDNKSGSALPALEKSPGAEKPVANSKTLKIIHLQNLDVDNGVAILKSLFGSHAKIVAESKSNTLIVESSNEHDLDVMEALLLRLDGIPPKIKSGNPPKIKLRNPPVKLNDPTEAPQSNVGNATDQPIMMVRVMRLDHIDAAECARFLKPMCDESSLVTPDKISNDLVIRATSDEMKKITEMVEALDAMVDKAIPRESGIAADDRRTTMMTGNSASIVASNSPKAQSLIDDLAKMETKAADLAQKIRRLAEEPSDNRALSDRLRRELDETLKGALALKFNLEQLQVEALETRLLKLKTQIARRTASVEQIVERRARELIDEDVSRWMPNDRSTGRDAAPKPIETQEQSDLTQIDDFKAAPPVGRRRLGFESSNPDDLEEGSIDTLIQSSTYRRFATMLPSINSRSVGFGEIVKRHEQEAVEARRRGDEQKSRLCESALASAREKLERHIQERKGLLDEYTAVMNDLEVQFEGARTELNAAETLLRRLNSSPEVVAKRTIVEAERDLRKAKLAFERIKIRYELYKKIGEGIQKVTDSTPDSEMVEILVAKTDIDPGIPLDDMNVGLRKWSKDAVPEGSITSKEQWAGRSRSQDSCDAKHAHIGPVPGCKGGGRNYLHDSIRDAIDLVARRFNADTQRSSATGKLRLDFLYD